MNHEILKYLPVVLIVFTLIGAWASFTTQLSAHWTQTDTLVMIAKETCRAVHVSAKLDPTPCFIDRTLPLVR